MIFLKDISVAEFARRKGSKDKKKRKPRVAYNLITTGALGGAGIGAITEGRKTYKILKAGKKQRKTRSTLNNRRIYNERVQDTKKKIAGLMDLSNKVESKIPNSKEKVAKYVTEASQTMKDLGKGLRQTSNQVEKKLMRGGTLIGAAEGSRQGLVKGAIAGAGAYGAYRAYKAIKNRKKKSK